MKLLYGLFFVAAALVSVAALSLSGGCAEVPGDRMPDPVVDTVVVVDTLVFDDTVVVCRTAVIGGSAAPSVCDTVVLGDIEVPFIVTRVDESVNSYCLYPITFTAFPAAEDLRHIEAVYLDLDLAAEGTEPVELVPPTWSAVFSYADTGGHIARMRVVMHGSEFVLTEEFEVRTAVRFDIPPVSISVEDTGSFHTFRAGGYRHRDACWVWDLTNIGGRVIKTFTDTVSAFVRGEHDTAVTVYQEDSSGRRTPGVDVGFKSVIGTMYSVTVEVGGAGAADISPRREFLVPYRGEVSVTVRALVNTKIASVSVNGAPRYVFDGLLVRDTALTFAGITSNTRILVSLAEIDTVMPDVKIVWPVIGTGDRSVVPGICLGGVFAYRLNKRMASGVARWLDLDNIYNADKDSLRSVRIPGDIFDAPHNLAELITKAPVIYESPKQYLEEGLQRFNFEISPVAAKRYTHGAGRLYRLELQFADSLGNLSAVESRIVNTRADGRSCEDAINEWLRAE
ncbi:MAG: hypothetical protein FWB85_00555 [Chitinispirillia bacterium]|nr:hypothetical protein [Chitinispirillia bacterium]MCL2240997.1 hypothetical protein [Chitinispirillia bacterium]